MQRERERYVSQAGCIDIVRTCARDLCCVHERWNSFIQSSARILGRLRRVMIALALWLWLPLWCSAASITKQFRPYDVAADNGEGGFYPVWSFVSEPDLTNAPMINWPQWSSRCDDGRLNFITPRGDSVSQPGPMILDGKGDLVWFQFFDNDFGGQAYDLKVQRYQGQNYLTFWLGNDLVSGHGAGIYYMVSFSMHAAFCAHHY